MKAVVAAFNQEKALVGAFSVITNLLMELFEALTTTLTMYLHSTQCSHLLGEGCGVQLAQAPAHGVAHQHCRAPAQVGQQPSHLITLSVWYLSAKNLHNIYKVSTQYVYTQYLHLST